MTDASVQSQNTPSASADAVRLRAESLCVGYNRRALLPALSFTIRPGEIWALFGPNGGGKSTLLRTILGLQPAVSGTLSRFDTELSAVLQRDTIDPLAPQRGIDVLRGGVDRKWSFLRPWLRASSHDAVAAAAAETQSTSLLKQPFQSLSEGQKQRLLIARALASDPTLLTLDEPTSAMDPFHEEAIFQLLQRITDARRLSIIVASHHMHSLISCATHAIYVDSAEGVATTGEFTTVAKHPAVQSRYGDLLATHAGASTHA